MNNLLENNRINLKPSSDWNKWLSTSFQCGRCECCRCQDNNYDESSYAQHHTFVINEKNVARKFSVTTVDDLKGKLKSAWVSYYDHREEAQSEGDTNSGDSSEKDVFISQLDGGQVELEKVKAFTFAENHIYLDALLKDIKVTFS